LKLNSDFLANNFALFYRRQNANFYLEIRPDRPSASQNAARRALLRRVSSESCSTARVLGFENDQTVSRPPPTRQLKRQPNYEVDSDVSME
jgi:hypothetical protein